MSSQIHSISSARPRGEEEDEKQTQAYVDRHFLPVDRHMGVNHFFSVIQNKDMER